MTDDLDPSQLLASAALDNEVDADERARVEESPELRQEMELYRTITAEMRAVEIPASSRESAVAAALAVFDEVADDHHAAARMMAPAPAVASLHAHRRRQQLWLGRLAGGLAAAAVVAVVGVAALRSGSGESKKSSSTIAVINQTAASVSPSVAKSSAADATRSSTESAQTPNIASTSGGSSGTTASATDPVVVAETAPFDPWTAAPSFTRPEELLAYATSGLVPSSTAAATAATTAATTATSATPAPVSLAACAAPADGSLIPVFYGGQRVYLARDDAAGVLRVLDPANCAEIFDVPLG